MEFPSPLPVVVLQPDNPIAVIAVPVMAVVLKNDRRFIVNEFCTFEVRFFELNDCLTEEALRDYF